MTTKKQTADTKGSAPETNTTESATKRNAMFTRPAYTEPGRLDPTRDREHVNYMFWAEVAEQ